MINVRNKKILESFGSGLRKLRESQGLTQKEVAFRADISISQMSRIERGLINPTLSTIYAISQSMELPVEELFKKINLSDKKII